MDTLRKLEATLCGALIEREAEVRAMLLGVVARENVLYVGPPGTAKSLMCSSLVDAISDARMFALLLTKYTAPEEVFGPVSLSALREDRYVRKLEGFIGTAHIAFLDEIWKASSAINNNLLTVLNEHVVDNGGVRVPVPLRLAVAASNEWPSSEEGKELGAIFDRFTIRRKVAPVSPQGRERLLYGVLPKVAPVITLAELDAAADRCAKVPVSAAARTALSQIFDELAGQGIRPGDRRARKAVHVARAAAVLDGAAEVLPAHLEDLSAVLWVDPEQADKAADVIVRIANPLGARVNELLREADQVVREAGTDAAARVGALKKLEEQEAEAAKLCAQGGNGRAQAALKFIKRERARLHGVMLGISPDKIEQMLALQEGA